MFALYPRLNGMGVPGYETSPEDVRILRKRLKVPLTWKAPRRVFVNSMSDLFHPDVDYEFVTDVFSTMIRTPMHIYQVLTKRPGRAYGWWMKRGQRSFMHWPDNVWIGTSVETQKHAPRLSVLGRIPATTRFVSAEPLLAELDLSQWLTDGTLHWVIAGGESGNRARPMDLR
jgi:protein gp37